MLVQTTENYVAEKVTLCSNLNSRDEISKDVTLLSNALFGNNKKFDQIELVISNHINV